VVIVAAFSGIVDTLVKGIIMPIIDIYGGKPSFDQEYITINGSNILLGTFLTALCSSRSMRCWRAAIASCPRLLPRAIAPIA
jgi:hypothetical protein